VGQGLEGAVYNAIGYDELDAIALGLEIDPIGRG